MASSIVGEYTGTLSLNTGQQLVSSGSASEKYARQLRRLRGLVLTSSLITPSNASPNGYLLDIGDASPCTEDVANKTD